MITDVPFDERSLGALLERNATTRGGRIFVRYGDQAVTYAEANERANRAAHALRGLGVGRAGLVAIMLPNCLEYLDVWFGLAKLGAVEVPINTEFKPAQILHVLEDSKAAWIVVDAASLPLIEELRGAVPHLRGVVVSKGPALTALGIPAHQLSELMSRAAATPPPERVPPASLLAILHTSGTTGPSKGVMVCHNHEYVLARNVANDMSLGEDDVFYNFYPLFHNTAQGIITWAVLEAGCTMVLRDRFSASAFWDDVRRFGCTTFYYIGAVLRILLETSTPGTAPPGAHPLRLGWGIAAGASDFTAFRDRFGVELRGGYGSTEANIPCFMPHGDPKPGSSGRALPGWTVRIVDEHDRPLAPGGVGEIVVRSEEPYAMMLGYFGEPEATLEAWRNLWFHTGDAGYFDADGDLFFVDRIRDVIRRRGENISSFDVESAVNAFEGVVESAAFAIPSELGEDEVKVAIVARDGGLDLGALVRFCEARLPGFAVPRYFELVAELPKTETGKVKKHLLKERGLTAGTWDRAREVLS